MFYTNLYAACPQKVVYFLTPSPFCADGRHLWNPSFLSLSGPLVARWQIGPSTTDRPRPSAVLGRHYYTRRRRRPFDYSDDLGMGVALGRLLKTCESKLIQNQFFIVSYLFYFTIQMAKNCQKRIDS